MIGISRASERPCDHHRENDCRGLAGRRRRPLSRLAPLFSLLRCIALVLSIAGVGAGSATADDTRTIVDDAGRQVTLPAVVNKVFVAGPPAAVLLYTLAPDKLIGWSEKLSDTAKSYIAAPYATLPVYGRLTGRGQTVDAATLQRLHPDLILDVGDVDAGYTKLADQVQQQTGIPYVLLNGHLDHSPVTYRRLGAMLGVEARGQQLALYAEHVLQALPAAIADLRADAAVTAKPRLYYGRGDDGLQSAGPGNINLELLDLIGAENVMADRLPDKLTKTTPAEIGAAQPDVILAQHARFAATIAAAPHWQKVPAVAAHRLYVQPLEPFGWADDPPGINRLLGAQWLALRLYPGLHWGDLRQTVIAFYDLFYQVKLSDAQVDALLHQAAARN
ncbi:MAG TPA: ABC transporter substrate-binding protein [Dongiaceae bacterium]|nr:ABC transporter substrate-binding protein [Dongiaceae bacterium]